MDHANVVDKQAGMDAEGTCCITDAHEQVGELSSKVSAHSPVIRITKCPVADHRVRARDAGSSPRSARCLSPLGGVGLQRRVSHGSTSSLEGESIRVARDPTQPISGSISDVHSAPSSDTEDADVFTLSPFASFRCRSHTSPDVIERRRRQRVRMSNRPPTPPPGNVSSTCVEREIAVNLARNKLHIPFRSLPELPERQAGQSMDRVERRMSALYISDRKLK